MYNSEKREESGEILLLLTSAGWELLEAIADTWIIPADFYLQRDCIEPSWGSAHLGSPSPSSALRNSNSIRQSGDWRSQVKLNHRRDACATFPGNAEPQLGSMYGNPIRQSYVSSKLCLFCQRQSVTFWICRFKTFYFCFWVFFRFSSSACFSLVFF